LNWKRNIWILSDPRSSPFFGESESAFDDYGTFYISNDKDIHFVIALAKEDAKTNELKSKLNDIVQLILFNIGN